MTQDPAAPSTSKQELAYLGLRDAILGWELKPGERVIGDLWCRKLGVSIIPMREAILRLVDDGLVVNTPYKGARVSPVDFAMIPEIFAINEFFQTSTGRFAAQRLDDRQIDELAAIVVQMDEALDDQGEWMRLNGHFHQQMALMAGLALTDRLASRAHFLWARIHYRYFRDVTRTQYKEYQPDHHEMIEVLRRRDAARMAEVCRRHALRSHQAFYDHMAKLVATGELEASASALPDEQLAASRSEF